MTSDPGTGEDVRTLVYPVPGPPSRFSRKQLIALMAAYLVAFAAGLIVLAHYLDRSLAGPVVIAGVVALLDRGRTEVSAETFTTRWVFRRRTVPVSEARDLSVRTIFGDPVYVRTGNGRKQRLHKVKPEHLADISALTGVPVRDWYHQ